MIIRQTEQVMKEVGKVLIGKGEVIEKVLMAIYAGGHILLEDTPGVGKTTLALGFSRALGMDYKRIQFTPDTMPSDITGYSIPGQDGQVVYRPGAVHTNLFLGDEINRTSPKTQASLLEAMAEGQVTVDGTVHMLPRPFLVIATQNPVEFIGTYPLPEAQLDRFMMRLSIGYPDREQEMRMAALFLEGQTPDRVERVCGGEEVLRIQGKVREVAVRESVVGYIEDIIALTRTEPRFVLGASPRAMLALLRASQGKAFLQGRDFVKPDDVKAVAAQVLQHRLALSSEARIQKADAQAVLKSLILKVKIPV